MAITVETIQQSITKKYQCSQFHVYLPPNALPTLDVYYSETLYDPDNNILRHNQSAKILSFTQPQLTGLITGNNDYGLPVFGNLYVGLRTFFDSQFQVNFSGALATGNLI